MQVHQTKITNASIESAGLVRHPFQAIAEYLWNGFDAGAKMDLMNKNASLSFNIRNLFGTRKFEMESATNASVINFGRFMTPNIASLTFSYRFGKSSFNFKKARKPNQDNAGPDEETF